MLGYPANGQRKDALLQFIPGIPYVMNTPTANTVASKRASTSAHSSMHAFNMAQLHGNLKKCIRIELPLARWEICLASSVRTGTVICLDCCSHKKYSFCAKQFSASCLTGKTWFFAVFSPAMGIPVNDHSVCYLWFHWPQPQQLILSESIRLWSDLCVRLHERVKSAWPTISITLNMVQFITIVCTLPVKMVDPDCVTCLHCQLVVGVHWWRWLAHHGARFASANEEE